MLTMPITKCDCDLSGLSEHILANLIKSLALTISSCVYSSVFTGLPELG